MRSWARRRNSVRASSPCRHRKERQRRRDSIFKQPAIAASPLPPRSGGEGSGVGVPQQTRCQTSKLTDPPPPTPDQVRGRPPPRHAQGRVEGGEITGTRLRDLAAGFARGLPEIFLTLQTEGAGNTGCALHPRSRVQQCTKQNAHEHTGSAEAIRHSLRNGFNGLFRALPGDRAFLPPSPALLSANLTPASGRQDHTTSPSAAVYAKGFDGLGTRPPKL
jgi:hypothetical protein